MPLFNFFSVTGNCCAGVLRGRSKLERQTAITTHSKKNRRLDLVYFIPSSNDDPGMVINDQRTKSKRPGPECWLVCLFLTVLLGCETGPPLPPLNLSAPGWHTRTGQAVWKPDRSKPEIVGDLLISWDDTGNAYLQFSKAFPIVSARLGSNRWEVEFPPQNKRYAAPGNPPARIVWLQLLRAMTGGEINRRWSLDRTDNARTLSNKGSGESLEVHF
jgi:hypothetical protein